MISKDTLAACMLALRMSIEHCKQARVEWENRSNALFEHGQPEMALEALHRAYAHDEMKDYFTSALPEIRDYIEKGGV